MRSASLQGLLRKNRFSPAPYVFRYGTKLGHDGEEHILTGLLLHGTKTSMMDDDDPHILPGDFIALGHRGAGLLHLLTRHAKRPSFPSFSFPMPVFSRQEKELITCGRLLAEIKARCDALTKGPKAPVLLRKLLMMFKVATISPGSRGPSGRRDALRKELCETPPKASDCVGAKMNLPPTPKIRGKDTPEFKEKRRILDAHKAIEKLYKQHSPDTFRGMDQRAVYNKVAEITLEGTGGELDAPPAEHEKFLAAERERFAALSALSGKKQDL